MNVLDVLGIQEGQQVTLRRVRAGLTGPMAQVCTGTYERWTFVDGKEYGPDLIIGWAEGNGLRHPIAYMLDKLLAGGDWVIDA